MGRDPFICFHSPAPWRPRGGAQNTADRLEEKVPCEDIRFPRPTVSREAARSVEGRHRVSSRRPPGRKSPHCGLEPESSSFLELPNWGQGHVLFGPPALSSRSPLRHSFSIPPRRRGPRHITQPTEPALGTRPSVCPSRHPAWRLNRTPSSCAQGPGLGAQCPPRQLFKDGSN